MTDTLDMLRDVRQRLLDRKNDVYQAMVSYIADEYSSGDVISTDIAASIADAAVEAYVGLVKGVFATYLPPDEPAADDIGPGPEGPED